MLTEDLFQRTLISPVMKQGADRLRIVSGYATASMADLHMEQLCKNKADISIELIIGMTRLAGIERVQHLALRKIAEQGAYGLKFACRYVVKDIPVHAKTYCWLAGENPVLAFAGSANYTRTAFGRSQVEVMSHVNAEQADRFYQRIYEQSGDCLQQDIEEHVLLTQTHRKKSSSIETVKLSLIVKSTGATPTRSGINWGQRPKRDPDQAYINIPAEVANMGFFPERGEPFTVLTDDSFSFIMVRAQDGGKGLHTTESNALLGRYLRERMGKRMGLESGAYVTREHLEEYGRTDVTFTKIDEETYLMDFRPDMGPGEDAESWQE